MSDKECDDARETKTGETAKRSPSDATGARPDLSAIGQQMTRKRKIGIGLGVCAIVIAAAGIGLWSWHNTPGFCNTMCHVPMDSYVRVIEQQPDTQGVDKWGNEVSNTSAMLSVTHAQAGQACLSCHVPTITQQMGELTETISGDYYFPLEEVNDENLMVNSGNPTGSGDAFCLRSGCHADADGNDVTTRAQLTELTADMPLNPHGWNHGDLACDTCHKSHRASVLYCTECHDDAYDELPEGWVGNAEGLRIELNYANAS